jgi:hypothetical protein
MLVEPEHPGREMQVALLFRGTTQGGAAAGVVAVLVLLEALPQAQSLVAAALEYLLASPGQMFSTAEAVVEVQPYHLILR